MTIQIYTIIVFFLLTLKITYDILFLKKITNKGYKFIFFDKILKKEIINLMISFIPIINVLVRLKEVINLIFIDNLTNVFINKSILVVKLNFKEKEILKVNSSLINIIKINLVSKIYADSVLVYYEDKKENIIYYNTDSNNPIITATRGNIKNESYKTKYKILKEQLEFMYKIKNNNSNISIYNNFKNF